MDQAEAVAQKWLLERGVSGLVHEPRGKGLFPDFADCAGNFFEVTRLNQIYPRNGRPLIEDGASYEKNISEAIIAASNSAAGWKNRYLISFSYRRPLINKALLFDKISSKLIAISDHDLPPARIDIEKCLSIHIKRADERLPYVFNIAAYGDKDAGGWVSEFIPFALAEAISKKTDKVHSFYREIKIFSGRKQRPSVHLILVDRTGSRPSDFSELDPELRAFKSISVIGYRNGKTMLLSTWGNCWN